MAKVEKLRLAGFKSFTDPTDLDIGPGVTGIVGPNGCGKSNLVDAFKWVMGESSAKQIRGDEMDEIIFGGTTNRPARNLAEVSLVLDNKSRSVNEMFNDTNELEITRKIERGKGSNYNVNGREVRAKDIQLLFADLGSGAKSTALVSQGKIGALINSKPTERRHLLEEAASITGLHNRRHEAELKLNATESNLERLNDVIEALHGQLQNLKKQARQAGRYKTISSSIRSAQALVFLIQHTEEVTKLVSNTSELTQIRKNLEEKMQAVSTASDIHIKAEKNLSPLRQKEVEKSAKVQRLQIGIKQLDDDVRRIENTKQQAFKRLNDIGEDISRENNNINDAQNMINKIGSSISELKALMEKHAHSLSESSTNLSLITKTVKDLESAQTLALDEGNDLREKLQKKREHTTKIETEISTLENLLKENQIINEWDPVIDQINIETGYELALEAVFSDELFSSTDIQNPIHWSENPDVQNLQELPEGSTPLSNYVDVPEKLKRRLSQVGYVEDDSLGNTLQASLKPGQRIVNNEGFLWRWDGFTRKVRTENNATKNIKYKNRLSELYEMHNESKISEKAFIEQNTPKEAYEEISKKLNDERKILIEAKASFENYHNINEDRKDRIKSFEEDQESWNHRLQSSNKQLELLETRKISALKEIEELSTQPQIIENKKSKLIDELKESEQEKTEATDDLIKAEQILHEATKNLRKADQEASTSREDQARSEANLNQINHNIQNLEKNINDVINCRPEDLRQNTRLKQDEELPELEKAEKSLQRLNSERENIGAVNLRAEQEYTELDQEINNLINEREDLNKAILKLRAGIIKLNKEGRQRLLQSFELVNKNFKELFINLFGGGKAELTLSGDSDPLEAGLEIYASPPGKKLQNLSLLSGGEQALTTVALLFAVFNVNPAPLCILDEVDAPLDDTNVDRFCNLISRISQSTGTKIIIVTHHRMTMARVDRLFGVTMAEKGVSKLVSVNLTEAERLRDSA